VFPPFEAVWSQLQEWGACPLFQELNALPPEEPDFIIVRDGRIAALYLFFDKLP